MSRHLVVDLMWGSLMQGLTSDSPSLPQDSGPPDRVANEHITEPYLYSSLPNLSGASPTTPFRLLRLLPGTRQDDIECQLVDGDLYEDANKYEALSYVWGNTSTHTPVQVNGATLQIGQNLRSALLNLRLPNFHRVLWVDAICINQADNAEKANQVPIMGDIYRHASQTVVWLGEATADTHTAFSHIQTLGDEALDLAKTPGKAIGLGESPAFKEVSNNTSVLDSIVKDSWWTRVWTAQEILLSKRAVLASGRHQADWDFFHRAIRYGEMLGLWPSALEMFGVAPDIPLKQFNDVDALRTPPTFKTPAHEMLFYLLRTRRRAATDPRDKIYGVLGLVGDSAQSIGIIPDYEASVSDAYTQATGRLIETSGNLDILGVCFPFKKRTVISLPSWVADWGSTDSLAWPLSEDAKGNPRTTHASHNTNAQPEWEDKGRVLVVEGHAVDIVANLSLLQRELSDEEMWDDSEFQVDTSEPWWEDLRNAGAMMGRAYENFTSIVVNLIVYVEWEEFVKQVKPTNPVPTSADPLSIYCQTLCTGTLAPGGLSETERLFRSWLGQFSPIKKLKAWKLDRAVGGMFRLLSLLGYVMATWKGYGEFFKYLRPVTERRLGSLKNGYLCLLPKLTKIGDQLAILKGGRVPLILRPRSDGAMEYIGEAYVHGIMDGEAFKEGLCEKIRIR
ncbi:heterokaryon incompatibility protein-domain-containing protein [Lasiosphaeria hispida]|uniref:Heterokaryon incompatibility protein-domain-containing protein n=1 Tax=Lasiosphaeria hispida TaxID=260671 RepID=A0AAJ0MA46_9PEZI|nr:heterokaryon incompatibility protein-domain-containing protein [Lasiosphaeria hispida]